MADFKGGAGARPVILKSKTYHFHRLDLTRQAGFIVTVYGCGGGCGSCWRWSPYYGRRIYVCY